MIGMKIEIEHYSRQQSNHYEDNFYNDLRDQHLNNNFKTNFVNNVQIENTCWS